MSAKLSNTIATTWDSQPVDHAPVNITFERNNSTGSLQIEVSAPFFNDAAPPGEPGQPLMKLWDYEVAEVFFLGDFNRYLEVELSPHGQHLLLFLDGARNSVKDSLPIEYRATIHGDNWTGVAQIPMDYFPPNITKFNAYAIHGLGSERTYEALYPAPRGIFTTPDFHRLELFQSIDLSRLLPNNQGASLSEIWQAAIEAKTRKST